MTDAVRLVGADRLRRTLDRAAHGLGDLKNASDRAALIVTQRGKVTAPRRTGRLAASIHPAPGSPNHAVAVADAAYAGVIHNGWRAHGITPQPWLAAAADSTQSEWMRTYQADVQHVLDHVKGV